MVGAGFTSCVPAGLGSISLVGESSASSSAQSTSLESSLLLGPGYKRVTFQRRAFACRIRTGLRDRRIVLPGGFGQDPAQSTPLCQDDSENVQVSVAPGGWWNRFTTIQKTVQIWGNCRAGRWGSASYGIGAGCIRVPQSQPRLGRIAASSVDAEFREGAEPDGAGGEASSTDNEDSGKEVKIDLQLPRRRLSVEFTCNVCQTRTQRLVNPDAYKRGTVYVQCGGCETYHQLVDNLGLVVEYDFREETVPNSS